MDNVEVVETVAEAVVETARAEVEASTAAAAAQTAVTAAQSAIAMSEAQSAQAQMDAARQVQIVVDDVEQVEENVLWLRQELVAHRTADRVWKERMELALQEILEVTRHLMQSQIPELEVSTQATLATETEVQNPNQVPNPSSADAGVPQEAETESRRKNRKTFL